MFGIVNSVGNTDTFFSKLARARYFMSLIVWRDRGNTGNTDTEPVTLGNRIFYIWITLNRDMQNIQFHRKMGYVPA